MTAYYDAIYSGFKNPVEQAAKDTEKIYYNMIENIQREWANSIDDMLSMSLNNIEEFGDAIVEIFRRSFSEIVASKLMEDIFKPAIGWAGEKIKEFSDDIAKNINKKLLLILSL